MPPRQKSKAMGEESGRKRQSPSSERETSEEDPHPQPHTIQSDPEVQDENDAGQTSENQSLTQSQSQPQSQDARRRKRESLVLTDKEEEDLAEWIRSNGIFYDKSRKDYKDTKLKTRMWQQKAEEMGHPVKDLEEWYKGMRTRFGRLSKTVSGQGAKEQTERDKWISRAFQFLSKHIVRVQSRQGCSLKQRIAVTQLSPGSGGESEDDVEEVEEEEEEEEEEDDHSTPATPSSSHTQDSATDPCPTLPAPSKKAKKSNKSAKSSSSSSTTRDVLQRLEERIESNTQLQSKISSMVHSAEGAMSSRTSWGQWMTSMMKDIHEDLWDDFMEKSFNMVTSFRRESQKLRQAQSQPPNQTPLQQQQFPFPHPPQQFPQQQYTQQQFHPQQFHKQQQFPQSHFLHMTQQQQQQQQQQQRNTSAKPIVLTGPPGGQPVASQPSLASSCQPPAETSTPRFQGCSLLNMSGLTNYQLSSVTQASPASPQMGDGDSG